MTQSQPPITRTTHTLPFDRLSPRDFERLCLWLVEREGYERAEHLGAAGSEQGRDIVAWREGTLWAFQCKRVQRFGPQDALAEVEKVLALPEAERPAGLVFIVTCDVSVRTRRKVRARCTGEMECHFWTGTELDEKINRHPDIVEEFFQPAERNVFQRLFGIGPDQQRAQRHRRTMLELVWNTWVKGVLEQSLHGAAMIELGLWEWGKAVERERPWDMVLHMPEQPDRLLLPGTKIVDVFDETNRALLILGKPGSGKTTMLLELARDTIARAEKDLTRCIPVVFNLSSWAEKKQPLTGWLVEELDTNYKIPERVARPWVENGDLLLLLDGLDEVKEELRDDCVQAINGFYQEHRLTPLVVCSRIDDYKDLTTKLKLQGAVVLQPLTPQQIDQYLDGVGTELAAVRETLQYDAPLQELARTPLMLSIMALAYRGISIEDLQALDTVVARRKHLFDAYVQRMFERRARTKRELYPKEQTIHWLAWLAQKMSVHAQTIFLIEGLQPDWLPAHTLRQVRIVARLGVGLVGGLAVGLVGGLAGGLFAGLVGGLVAGLVVGLVVGLVFGLVVGLVVGLAARLDFVEPVETLKWSWKRTTIGLVSGLVGGLVVGLCGGLGVGLCGGLVVGLGVGLGVGLLLGLENVEIGTKTVPNQGIRQSAKNALVTGLFFGLFFGLVRELVVVPVVMLVLGLFFGLFFGLVRELAVVLAVGLGYGPVLWAGWWLGGMLGVMLVLGLFFGLAGGLFAGLLYGGNAVILHFALRYVLWRNGYLPWSLVRFLDYAAERIFLRKVGGGYIFVHGLLQDYFASLYQGQ